MQGHVGVRDMLKSARPEDLPDHRRILEELLLARAALEEEIRELLGVERVPPGSLEKSLLRAGLEHRSLEQLSEQARRLLVRQGRERERRRVQLAPAPTRAPLEQLGLCGSYDEQRDVAHPVDQLVHEVEEALVGPVQVLEDEDERTLLRESLEQAPPRCERLA